MKRMLIVDDSPSWVRYHESAVKQLFGDIYEIDTASSAVEANDKIYLNADEPYDVILTDMQMETNFLPLFAGEWLIEQIQNMKEYSSTRIVIISATSNIASIAKKYNVEFIPKYSCRDVEIYRDFFAV